MKGADTGSRGPPIKMAVVSMTSEQYTSPLVSLKLKTSDVKYKMCLQKGRLKLCTVPSWFLSLSLVPMTSTTTSLLQMQISMAYDATAIGSIYYPSTLKSVRDFARSLAELEGRHAFVSVQNGAMFTSIQLTIFTIYSLRTLN